MEECLLSVRKVVVGKVDELLVRVSKLVEAQMSPSMESTVACGFGGHGGDGGVMVLFYRGSKSATCSLDVVGDTATSK